MGLENGEVEYSTSPLKIPWKIPCEHCGFIEFYIRKGTSSTMCQSTGNWSQEAPKCNASNGISHTKEFFLGGFLNIIFIYKGKCISVFI